VRSIKELKKQLFFNQQNIQKKITDQKESEKIANFAEKYKTFLSECKTERECISYFKFQAQNNGFSEFNNKKKYNPGDKFFYINRGKAMILVTVGKNNPESGVSIIASHVDSPRIDIKPKPMYEKNELAYFKTHYYGGIKKYQWATIPLSMHGKIIKRNGEEIELKIGEKADEPIFCITDLLPHLASEQMKRSAEKSILGEELNLLIGSLPCCENSLKEETEHSDLVKLNVLQILNKTYGIIEKDLIAAEISFVPAVEARDVGFDKSMIAAYGQDDRVCAYTSFQAHMELKTPEYTILTVFADKEEIGSNGNTGLESFFLEFFITDLAESLGVNIRRVLEKSCCLSADVNAAFDPTWSDAYEKNNTSLLNCGAVVTKYTGSGGKVSTSDATAEFVHKVISILDANDIVWQSGMLGKVDTGGGGTVSKFIARFNIDVIDFGVPVLSMHSPYEITAKQDVYMLYRACTAFANRNI
jgi:aspartyl aminopeptidase